MVAPSKRSRTYCAALYVLAACLAALMMLRSFRTWDHFSLVRPHSATYLQSGNGFLAGGYASTATPYHSPGFFHAAAPIRPFSLAMFEDESLFMSHFKRSFDGFDCELFGFRIALSCTDERNMTIVQLPQWAPVAAFSLLACGNLIRRASRLLCPRPSPGFDAITNATAS